MMPPWKCYLVPLFHRNLPSHLYRNGSAQLLKAWHRLEEVERPENLSRGCVRIQKACDSLSADSPAESTEEGNQTPGWIVCSQFWRHLQTKQQSDTLAPKIWPRKHWEMISVYRSMIPKEPYSKKSLTPNASDCFHPGCPRNWRAPFRAGPGNCCFWGQSPKKPKWNFLRSPGWITLNDFSSKHWLQEKLQSQSEGHRPHSVPLCIRAEDFELEKDKAVDYTLLGCFPSPSETFLHLIYNLTQPKELWSHELILSLLK